MHPKLTKEFYQSTEGTRIDAVVYIHHVMSLIECLPLEELEQVIKDEQYLKGWLGDKTENIRKYVENFDDLIRYQISMRALRKL